MRFSVKPVSIGTKQQNNKGRSGLKVLMKISNDKVNKIISCKKAACLHKQNFGSLQVFEHNTNALRKHKILGILNAYKPRLSSLRVIPALLFAIFV